MSCIRSLSRNRVAYLLKTQCRKIAGILFPGSQVCGSLRGSWSQLAPAGTWLQSCGLGPALPPCVLWFPWTSSPQRCAFLMVKGRSRSCKHISILCQHSHQHFTGWSTLTAKLKIQGWENHPTLLWGQSKPSGQDSISGTGEDGGGRVQECDCSVTDHVVYLRKLWYQRGRRSPHIWVSTQENLTSFPAFTKITNCILPPYI